MSDMIDRLKEGLAEAQKRHAEVARRFSAVQVEFQAVVAEVNGYVKVIELETRRELEEAIPLPPNPKGRPRKQSKKPSKRPTKPNL